MIYLHMLQQAIVKTLLEALAVCIIVDSLGPNGSVLSKMSSGKDAVITHLKELAMCTLVVMVAGTCLFMSDVLPESMR
ncbi:hypothetical protein ACHAWC_006112 [Mediolabrus comicus]